MHILSIFLFSALSAWWFQLLALAAVLIIGYILHSKKLTVLEHAKADLERQVLEKSELLSYARLNEQRSREEALLSDRNKSQLISKISHDIRTPMTTMMGMAALLNETRLTNEQRDYTSNILVSGDGLITLINDILMGDILEYSKVDSGKELELKEFELHACVEEVLQIFALKTANTAFDIVYDIDQNMPTYVIGDNQRLRQILMNLIENAIKFTTKGDIVVGVHFLEERKDNRLKLEFEIRDTGIGIPRIKLEQLEKELSQPGTSFNANTATGVGLIISKKLVEFMGGSIRVESSENVGTTVKFTILVRKSLQTSRALLNSETEGFIGKKVLVINQSHIAGNLLKRRLERWKLTVSVADSAEKALGLLSQHGDFNLVMNDMQLTGSDSIELAHRIKENYPGLPIIMVNKPGDENYKTGQSLFSSVIYKPIRQHVLHEQLLNSLRENGLASQTVEQNAKPILSVEFAKKYPLRIILAEDNIMNQKLVSKILNKLGYDPYITSNGKEVLEEVSNNNYDLILMDVQMPEMDGLEATRMIRLCLNTQPVIIAMTANTMQGDREECLQAGMDDYIGKPVKLDDLVNILEKWAIHTRQPQ